MHVCTSLQTDNHASTPPVSFFTGRMPFLPPNQQCQSTEGNFLHKAITTKWAITDCVLNLPLNAMSELSSIWSSNHANAFGPSVMLVPKCTGEQKPSYWLQQTNYINKQQTKSMQDFCHLLLLWRLFTPLLYAVQHLATATASNSFVTSDTACFS